MNAALRNGYHPNGRDNRPSIVAFLDDRLPPQNILCEQSVLGGLLLEWDLMHEVAGLLKPEDFYRDTHEAIYRAMLALHSLGRRVDSIVLADELDRRGEFETVGGAEAIAGILASVPHAANTTYHARIVREKAVTRRIVEQANATLKAAYSNLQTAEELGSSAVAAFDAIARGTDPGGTASLYDAIGAAMDQLARRIEGEIRGVSTGLPQLDSILGGCLGDGRLIVVAGRPGSGKTGLGLNIASHAAVDGGAHVLYFSLEMAGPELGERVLSARSGVFGYKLREPSALTSADATALGRVATYSEGYSRLEIDDRPGRTLLDIVSYARRARAVSGIGLVVIDYLQLIRETGGDDRGRARHEVVGEISARLKGLARELDIPVLALCQLNRLSELSSDKRPMLSHLRESGSVEQDADQVILVHRPEMYDKADRPGEADLIVAKNRQGQTGTVRARFNGPLSRFEPFADFIPPAAVPGGHDEPF